MTTARTFTIEVINDVDGLMTTEPAPLEPTVYDAEDFDGAFAQEAGAFHAGRRVSLTLSDGEWNDEEPVEIEGVWGIGEDGRPAPRVEHITLPMHTEQETTLHVKQPFAFPPGVKVTFPMQPRGGTFKLGVADAVAPDGHKFDDVRAGVDGHVAVQFDDEHDDQVEMLRGERLGVPVVAVIAERTTAGVTLFFPRIISELREQASPAAREAQQAIPGRR